jgi:catechol 2,3-dioxygenase-like lactoylglutathione lyase family enzyme
MDPFRSYDHVQLAMPAGEEDAARAFYGDVLGMRELEKPEELRARGGAWFASGDVVHLHLGVETPFVAANKAHPAFRCVDLPALRARLRESGARVVEGRRSVRQSDRIDRIAPCGTRRSPSRDAGSAT